MPAYFAASDGYFPLPMVCIVLVSTGPASSCASVTPVTPVAPRPVQFVVVDATVVGADSIGPVVESAAVAAGTTVGSLMVAHSVAVETGSPVGHTCFHKPDRRCCGLEVHEARAGIGSHLFWS